MPELLHNKLTGLLKQFLVLGGMPEVVSTYAAGRNLQQCQRVLDDLIISLKSDFMKYKKNVPSLRILDVFESVSAQMGNKFVFAKTSLQYNLKQLKEAIELLIMSGLVIPVTHTSANGLPLGAEADNKKRKMLIFDTGIFQRLLGLDINVILFSEKFDFVNKGAIAELYIGLEILKSYSVYQKQDLYYWHRETVSSNAEVDYILQKNQNIIPAEVKSAKKGSMKSMHVFLEEKNRNYGVRFALENYSVYGKINVYPLYAVSNFISSD